MEIVEHVIGGALVPSRDGRRFDSIDPYTREPWASVALGDVADVALALDAARDAFDYGPWPRLSAKERSGYLYRFAELIEANAAEISLCDTRDMGKPNGDGSGAGVAYHAEHLRECAEHAKTATAATYPTDGRHHIYTDYAPAGVVAAITPWNFPVMMVLSKLAPALAWGNTVVLKPAEQTPASATLIGRLALDAGIPPGVVNVVHGMGPDSVGSELACSGRIDRLTFTGSTEAGAAIARAAASNLVPVTLECGGKGPNIIFADADLGVAVKTAAAAVFSNSGQICVVGSRLLVHSSIFDDVVEALVADAGSWVLGDPTDPATTLGPLASRDQFERVTGYLDSIPADGGEILTGGVDGNGWFVRPTVAVGLKPGTRVCREEIFGPVVTVSSFDDDDEAIAMANDTRYGLSASLFTQDFARAHRVAGSLRAGTVWVNTFGVLDWRAPFGGFKQSGLGREGGEFSRAFFTEPRTVVMGF